jgi:magnesium-transporting ATPase (P-type)
MVDVVGTISEDRPKVSSMWLEGQIFDLAKLSTKATEKSDNSDSIPTSTIPFLDIIAMHIKTPESCEMNLQRQASTSHRGSSMRLRRATFGAISKAEIKKVHYNDQLRIRGASDNGGGLQNPNILRIKCEMPEKPVVLSLEHKKDIDQLGIAAAFEGGTDKVAGGVPKRKISPLDAALAEFIKKFKRPDAHHDNFEVLYEVPLANSRRCHLVIVQQQNNNDEEERYQLMVKGAPEEVIKNCSTIISSNGIPLPMDDDRLVEFEVIPFWILIFY